MQLFNNQCITNNCVLKTVIVPIAFDFNLHLKNQLKLFKNYEKPKVKS